MEQVLENGCANVLGIAAVRHVHSREVRGPELNTAADTRENQTGRANGHRHWNANFGEDGPVLGDDQRAPSVTEILDVLAKPDQNAVVNLIGLELNERPKFFEALLPRIQELRASTGRRFATDWKPSGCRKKHTACLQFSTE